MDKLKSLVESSKSCDIIKTINHDMQGILFHHHVHILYDLRTFLGKDKKTYMEIGTFHGGVISLILQHPYRTEIHAVDPLNLIEKQQQNVEMNIKKYNKYDYNVTLYKKYSTDQTLLNNFKKSSFNTDILFIDGGHSFSDVINDFYNYEKFVNSNGFICFDDYNDYQYSAEVKHAVDFIVSQLDTRKYEIWGCLENTKKAYDCLSLDMNNIFIIYKK